MDAFICTACGTQYAPSSAPPQHCAICEEERQYVPPGDAQKAGGTLADIVTMTVFIRNQADGDEFVKIRAEIFKSGFPASALITAKDFEVPQLLVEIQAIAVIGERN
jgi:hypothetical protein